MKYLHKGNKSSTGESNEKAAERFGGISALLLATKQGGTQNSPGLVYPYAFLIYT